MSDLFRTVVILRLAYLFDIIIARLNRAAVEYKNQRHMFRLKHCGRGVRFNGPIFISGHDQITLEDNVHIGTNAFIRGEGGLFIGANTHISRNLVLYTINHNSEGVCLPYDNTMVHKPVRLGKNVWVGMNVVIAPGTIIGDGAILAAGAVISGEIPSLAIVGNSKWRVLGWRDREHYQQLEHAGKYGGSNGVPLFSIPEGNSV